MKLDCCEDMKDAVQEEYIKIGEHEFGVEFGNTDVNIFNCSPWPEGAVWDEMKITYCPFCGKEIKGA